MAYIIKAGVVNRNGDVYTEEALLSCERAWKNKRAEKAVSRSTNVTLFLTGDHPIETVIRYVPEEKSLQAHRPNS